MLSVVHVLSGAVAAQSDGGSSMVPLLMTGGMVALVYFLMIRPQARQQKEHGDFLSRLQKGTEVVTYGGLVGKVHAVAGETVTVEIAKDVRVQVMKNMVYAQKPKAPADAKADKGAEASQPAAEGKK